jgi:nucleotidyltransferase substrate binding protein (TIGR01987 family)
VHALAVHQKCCVIESFFDLDESFSIGIKLVMDATMKPRINELVKTHESLKISVQLHHESLKNEPKNIELHKALRDSCIQRFEFCIELAWKTSIKILGLQTKAPNPAVRDMAQNGLITDTKLWFKFLESRNKTSHSYDEEVAKEVYEDALKIIPAIKELLLKLDNLP